MLLKTVELELKSNQKLSFETLSRCAELPDWDYRIVQAFIMEVQLNLNSLEFIYKKYNSDELPRTKKKFDLCIAATKRLQNDLCLTDVKDRLVIPQGITYDYIETWGLPVDQARNYCMKKALESVS